MGDERGRRDGTAADPVGAALVQAEAAGPEQRNLLVEVSPTDSQKRIYDLFSVEEPRPIDGIVGTSGLNFSEVLATLFDLEGKGMVRQLPGKAVQQGAVVSEGVSGTRRAKCTQRDVSSIFQQLDGSSSDR